MNFSCLYHFDSSNVSLLEVRVTDLPSEAPIQHRLHWLLVNKDQQLVTKLTFMSMTNNAGEHERQFAEGSLHFNEASARYLPALSRENLDFVAVPTHCVQPALAVAVEKFLEQYLQSVKIVEPRGRTSEIPLQP